MTEFFPIASYDSCESFAGDYFATLAHATQVSDLSALDKVAALLSETIAAGNFIYICGNGGSAGIANHSLCDFLKCVRTDTDLAPRFMSLSAHTEMNSALANDISYDEVFAYQLQSMARPGDLVWTVSSSGDSQNVVRALEVAKKTGLKSISFTGFSGGRSKDLADVNVHVNAQNYGVVEDIHMAFIHILTQYLRMTNMDASLIEGRKF
ncbi:SIS domain-containing protein [Phaeobacter sp. QD34_3]|uniref:SIS domain-containing protein n=1 Tax=unclassified Phaeobacter TaxID=2621772 RepID=UPI00237EF896|nr:MULTISPECIES: SIS domain-containing protein [unclassified Phaeobacter]MDE4134774.1 SIS domain-containing protein [Phaeobacter sp. QD34_3]MDE4138432.1 SIS domain-containing protein [Phaeobacter sp. QD34_24]